MIDYLKKKMLMLMHIFLLYTYIIDSGLYAALKSKALVKCHFCDLMKY